MNREIKFRAWNSMVKRMLHFGNPIGIADDVGRYGMFLESLEGKMYIGGDYEIMQFTGLHDKNGKEIYTGDIIQQFDERCVVRDCPGSWELGMINGGNAGSTFVISFLGEYCEVIGNFYDNPELLEVTKV